MSTAMVTTNSEELVLQLSDGSTESYQMTTVPPDTAGWVVAAKQEILHDMTLEGMLGDLDRSADLIYIAYNGVTGTGTLAASVSTKQKELADLCSDCVIVMQGFVTLTDDVLRRLTEAYKWLLRTDEPRALKTLARCATAANQMAASCKDLAGRFKVLKEETSKDAATAETQVGEQNQRTQELNRLKGEMKASLANQVQLQQDLGDSLEELETQITEATAREDKESERAFITGLVGAVAGALTAGVSTYVQMSNPAAAMASSIGKMQGNGGQSSGNGNSNGNGNGANGELLKAKDLTAKNEALSKANTALQELRQKVTDLESTVDAKQQAVDAAEDADKEAAQTELETETTALEAARTEKTAAETAVVDAQTALDEAKAKTPRDYTAAIGAAGAVAGSVADSANTMADNANTKAESIRSERLKLIDLKMQQQREKRDAAAKIAELNAQMGANAEELGVAESSLHALQMAVWAFSNIHVALLNAQTFWNSLASFCKRLGDSDVIARVKDEAGETGTDTTYTKEERKEYYLSDMFMPSAVAYLVRWAALRSICQEYVTAANKTYGKVTGNIKKSPSIAESRAQMDALRANYEERAALEEATFKKNNDALLAEKQELLAVNS